MLTRVIKIHSVVIMWSAYPVNIEHITSALLVYDIFAVIGTFRPSNTQILLVLQHAAIPTEFEYLLWPIVPIMTNTFIIH